MTWTTEREQRLAKLWAEGLSASQIATRLGGITRNGVIGKVHRMGLPRRAPTVNRTARPARLQPVQKTPPTPAKPVRAKRARLNAGERVAKPSLGLSILDVKSGQCRYATHEEAGEYRFCGHETHASSSYCPAHWFLTVNHAATDRHRKRKPLDERDRQKMADLRRASGMTRAMG